MYQFAVAPPYSFSRLQSYLGVLETIYPNTFERAVIGKTLVWIKYTVYYVLAYQFRLNIFFYSKEENWNCKMTMTLVFYSIRTL